MPFVTVLTVSLGLLIRSPHWVRLPTAGVEIGTPRARAVLIPLVGRGVGDGSRWVGPCQPRRRPALGGDGSVAGRGGPATLDAYTRRPARLIRAGRALPSGPRAVTAALRARGVPQARANCRPPLTQRTNRPDITRTTLPEPALEVIKASPWYCRSRQRRILTPDGRSST